MNIEQYLNEILIKQNHEKDVVDRNDEIIENITDEIDEIDEKEGFIGIYFVQLNSGEKFISATFIVDDDDLIENYADYSFKLMFFEPLRILEFISHTDINIQFVRFNQFMEDNYIILRRSDISYMGECNKETKETYDNFIKEITEYSLNHKNDENKTISKTILNTKENIIFGKFTDN